MFILGGLFMEKNIFILIIIIILIPLCGCFENEEFEEYYSFEYTIKINFQTNTNFSLLCPIPLWLNGTPSNIIVSKLKFSEGHSTFSINDTIYGKALSINGYGNTIELKSVGESKEYPYHTLSLQNKSKGREFMVWLDNELNNPIFVEILCNCNGGEPFRNTISQLSGEIINGWNILEGIESSSGE